MTNEEIADLRYAWMGTSALAEEIKLLRDGPGQAAFDPPATALRELSKALAATDEAIRGALKPLGTEWTGAAAQGGQQVVSVQGQHAGVSGDVSTAVSSGVHAQGGHYSGANNKMPDPAVLAQNAEADKQTVAAAGMFGPAFDDHTRKQQAAREQEEQAKQAFEQYARSSQQQLDGYRPLPAPPPVNLQVGDVSSGSIGSTTPAGWSSPSVSSTSGVPGTGSSTVIPPGGGGTPYVPTVGGGGSGTPPVVGPPGTPGPGPIVGPGPVPGGGPISNVPGGGLPIRPGMGIDAAQAAALAASGLGGGVVDDEERRARPGSRGPGGAPGVPKPGAVPLGAPDAEEARAARNAERVAPRQAPRAGGLMSPAAMAGAGAGAPGEDDDLEHKDKYGFGDPEMFEDDTLVAPATIGEDDE
ncbi:PPE family protein [Herbihabitans rhizosphaerae]|uniref:PPE family protein n=1 Tax=Herbihabitans rhizosphaerae TaxID=1872711 RepID=A0A4Q7KW38_9PSEU|nr:PPE domain-containing protein [Herbihabitans rhizosphaerae]RZS40964.1 PPE family protein [Herbihabitans rhizosphaerae]